MTTEEALACLGIGMAEDAEDAFEAALFETKKFLLSGPVFLKTSENRLAKLARQQEAFLFLGGEEPPETAAPATEFVPSGRVIDHLLTYHAAKNTLRKALSAAETLASVGLLASALIALERQFAEPFAAFPDWTEAPVTMGREPDVMEVLALLKEQAAAGRHTLAEIQQSLNYLPEELRLALKRLSLLKKYLYP